MSDWLEAITAHLNAEPSMCACGHPSVLHADGPGCVAIPWGEGPPCVCGDPDMAQWNLDHPDGISAEELEAMDRYADESCQEEGRHG